MTDKKDAVQAIRNAIDLFHAGDLDGFRNSWTKTGVVIIDDFFPFIWSGEGALVSWMADASAYMGEFTEPSVKTGDPVNVVVDRDAAAVVIPVVITYSRDGVDYRQDGVQFYALQKQDGNWKLQSMTHSGPPAVPA